MLQPERDADKILNIIERGNLSDLDDLSDDEDIDINLPQTSSRVRVGADVIGPETGNTDEVVEVSEPVDYTSSANDESFITPRDKIRWRRSSFISPNIQWNEPDIEDSSIQMPIQYFKRYFTDDIFDKFALYTNMYALQKNISNFKYSDTSEIQSLFGLHIMIGCLKFPRVHLYWDKALGLDIFLDTMSRDRFFQLRNNLHIVNLLEMPEPLEDRIYKVRPVFDVVRQRCLELTLEENLCIDEQIVPFRGSLNIKQYVKGKPTPWGVKIFVLCGKSGLAYDFIVYQGAKTGLNQINLKKYGFGASVILHLSDRISNPNHKLYYDNYFSSFHLLQLLKFKSIYAAGTARINRFSSPPLLCDKDLKKRERGAHDEVVTQEGDVTVVKWLDNRTVTLASNFVGSGATDEVRRWDSSNKQYINISRPEVVKLYNHAMGGVDVMDQMIGLYRIYIRSKKWTLRMIFHAVDFSLVNSWVEYRKDCQRLQVPEKNILDLLHFRIRVAQALIKSGKSVLKSKRGRPTSARLADNTPPKKPKWKEEVRPIPEVQHDLVDHMPQLDGNKDGKRCKYFQCQLKTHFYCDKCNIHLCIKKERNCFAKFHRKQ